MKSNNPIVLKSSRLSDECIGTVRLTLEAERVVRRLRAKSGYTEVDIIPRIYTHTVEEGEGGLILTARISAQNPGMNPELILKALEERAPEAVPDFTRFHRVEIYDKDGNVFR